MKTIGEPVCFLLVDDLEENLLALEALLKSDDVQLLKARSGDEALELLLQHEVALALLDVKMPGMTGFELAEYMRGNERTRHVPIIFVTAGTADSQRRFQGYEAGAVDFIQKPIEADILRSKATVFADLYRQRRLLATQRDELARASEALREADRRKDEFLAILGHELRNPIASLLAGLNLLKRRTGSDADTIRATMERQLFHLTRLIDDILDISRINEGKISLQKESIDLETVLQSAIETSLPYIEAAKHNFTTTLPDGPARFNADRTRIAQIVANLLNNAAKYTPTGGEVGLIATLDETHVNIEVTDNGVGIPLHMQSQIFDIFTQVDDHRNQSAGGLGIGLALVHQLVTLHDGSITVQSEGAGKGRVFQVRIPRHSDPKMD
jgi:signal transduction histidine kinase